MKPKSVVFVSAFLTSILGFTVGLIGADKAAAKAADKAPIKKPTLKIDASPVGEGKGGVVTSYADSLEAVRPAVISVYSSKIVRQQVPEFLRQFGAQGRAQNRRVEFVLPKH